MISVIVPVYNRQTLFLNCLKNLLEQTFRDIEIIVVDDGSEPKITIPEIYSKLVHIFYQENKGAAAARNFGFAQSKGDYLFFCDADVIARPDLLEKMHTTLTLHPEASYVYCDFLFGKKRMRGQPFDERKLLTANYISTMSMIRRNDFFGFDESLKRFQDWDIWLTLLEQNKKGVYLSEELFSVSTQGTMSVWLPSFCYHAPWKYFPYIRGEVKKFNTSKKIILDKHPSLFEAKTI